MFFSVIIPTCNRNDLLELCLQKISPYIQTTEALYEIIVADDSKKNDAKQLIEESTRGQNGWKDLKKALQPTGIKERKQQRENGWSL
jgi:GT2 family glycosyltransferase